MAVRIVVGALLVAASGWAGAASLDVAVSSDAADFAYATRYSAFGMNNSELRFGLTYNEDDDWVASGALEVVGDAAAAGSGLHAGAGVAVLLGDVVGDTVIAIGITGNLRYVFPEANRCAVGVRLALAPEITSFSDSEGYSAWSIQGEYELTRAARLFLGLREIEVELENRPDVEVDDGGYFGISIQF